MNNTSEIQQTKHNVQKLIPAIREFISLNKTTKKILLLWSPLADYSVACFKQLSLKSDIQLKLIYQAEHPNAPYDEFDLSFCHTVTKYSSGEKEKIYDDCITYAPDIIIMTSWNYKLYMAVSKKCRRKGTYVISTFDGQWRGTIKQRLGIMISPFFLKPAIDNFFVPGDRQAIFSRKLGFKNPLQGYYSANTNRFIGMNTVEREKNNFIFVGRLAPEKGIEQLINAYKKYRGNSINPWGLIICGKGQLEHLCTNQEGIEMYGFIQSCQLPVTLSEAKCLILPSIFEPWGLVVHEAALAGLLIITSFACGASTFFVRDGQNGYVINPDEESLVRSMKLVAESNKETLNKMSETSRALGSLWTTEKWADYVYQNICAKSTS